MFGRRSATADKQTVAADPASAAGAGAGKGRPTPRRREVEAARRTPVGVPAGTKRDLVKGERDEMRKRRAVQRQALVTGDEANLPRRDRGPVRRYVRDWVDSRRTPLPWVLPLSLAALLAGSLLQKNPTTKVISFYLVYTIFVGAIVVGYTTYRRLKKVLRTKFPEADLRGAGGYGLSRSMQFRRLRLPKPRVSPGDPV